MRDGQEAPFLKRTSTLVSIGVGLVAILGGLTTFLTRDKGPTDEERYRAKLKQEICLGELNGAARSSNLFDYAGGTGGDIDKNAWLTAMATTRSHLAAGLEDLKKLEPPESLRSAFDRSVSAWEAYIRAWEEWRAHTGTLPASSMDVFSYPDARWKARMSSAQSSFEVALSKLLGSRCDVGSSSPGA